MFSFVLGVYLGAELLGHMVTMFKLLKNCQTLFYSSCTTLQFPAALNKHSNFPIFSTTRYYLPLWLYLPSRCEVVSHWGFWPSLIMLALGTSHPFLELYTSFPWPRCYHKSDTLTSPRGDTSDIRVTIVKESQVLGHLESTLFLSRLQMIKTTNA